MLFVLLLIESCKLYPYFKIPKIPGIPARSNRSALRPPSPPQTAFPRTASAHPRLLSPRNGTYTRRPTPHFPDFPTLYTLRNASRMNSSTDPSVFRSPSTILSSLRSLSPTTASGSGLAAASGSSRSRRWACGRS